MKNSKWTLIAIIIVIACGYAIQFNVNSKTGGEGRRVLSELPQAYPLETAVKNGDYIQSDTSEVYNGQALADFKESAAQGVEAALRQVKYSDGGEPVIYDIRYDGNRFTVTEDDSRTQTGSPEHKTREYLHLIIDYENEYGIYTLLSERENIEGSLENEHVLEFYQR